MSGKKLSMYRVLTRLGLGLLLLWVTWIATAQTDGTLYDFEDGYSVQIPAAFQYASLQAGSVTLQNPSLIVTIFSPRALGGVPSQMPREVLFDLFPRLSGLEIDVDSVGETVIDERAVVYYDYEFDYSSANGETAAPSASRFYVLTMSDGAFGVVNVVAAENTPADSETVIEAILVTFDGEALAIEAAPTLTPGAPVFEIYPLSDNYAVTLPANFEVLANQDGYLVAQNQSVQAVFFDAGLIPTIIAYTKDTDPVDIFAAVFADITGGTVTPVNIAVGEAFGRRIYSADFAETVQGEPVSSRLVLVEMSDQTFGVLLVRQFSPTFTLAEGAVGALVQIFDTTGAIERIIAATQPDANDATPQATAALATETLLPTTSPTPTITPTPAPLEPTGGLYVLTIEPSDGEATCQFGFIALESALGSLTLSGVLMTTNALSFTGTDPEGTTVTLELTPDTALNTYTGELIVTDTWRVNVRLTQTDEQLFVGGVTTPFTITLEDDTTYVCADQAGILLSGLS